MAGLTLQLLKLKGKGQFRFPSGGALATLHNASMQGVGTELGTGRETDGAVHKSGALT